MGSKEKLGNSTYTTTKSCQNHVNKIWLKKILHFTKILFLAYTSIQLPQTNKTELESTSLERIKFNNQIQKLEKIEFNKRRSCDCNPLFFRFELHNLSLKASFWGLRMLILCLCSSHLSPSCQSHKHSMHHCFSQPMQL